MEDYSTNLSSQSGSLQERADEQGSQRQVSELIERWADVSDFTGLYQVSSLGRVRRTKSQRLLRPFVAVKSPGYKCVNLRRDGMTFRCLVRDLVAEAFVPKTIRGVLWSDDVTDDSAAGLEWISASESSARWFRRNGGRARDADGKFRVLERITEAMEAMAADDAAKGWK